MAGERNYWLFKSEPDVFSIHDLAASKGKTTSWEGVRNYQVRNMLRDDMRVGDGVLFYHSRVNPMSIVGTAEIVKAGYPDPSAFQTGHRYFDPKSKVESPTWYLVDIRLKQIFDTPVAREQLQNHKTAAGMKVMSKGSRLSITPVTLPEWEAVHQLAAAKIQ